MKIKAIIFDSSVLIDLPKRKMKAATNKIISYYLKPKKFMARYKRLFKQLQKGKINETKFYQQLLKDLPARSVKRVKEQLNTQRNHLINLVDDVKGVLNTLSNYYKLGLISNMPRQWFLQDAERLGLNAELFRARLFSSETGVLKPNKELFIKACKELKEKPNRCAYITNHEDEARGANDTGLTVIMVGKEGGDMRINKLTELIDIFKPEDEITKNIHEVDEP